MQPINVLMLFCLLPQRGSEELGWFLSHDPTHTWPLDLSACVTVGWRWCFEDGGQTCFSQAWAAVSAGFSPPSSSSHLVVTNFPAGAWRVPGSTCLFPLRHNDTITAFVVYCVSRYLGNEWAHNRLGLPYKSNYSVRLINASRCFHVLTSVVTQVIGLWNTSLTNIRLIEHFKT